jgi:hypothetical protein
MTFGFDRQNLKRLGPAVATGAAIAAIIISAANIADDQAEWYDWLIIYSGGIGAYLTSSLLLVRCWLNSLDRDQDAEADEFYNYINESATTAHHWRGSVYPYYRPPLCHRGANALVARSELPNSRRFRLSIGSPSPSLKRVDPNTCQDLGLLDTQWAELCQHQVQAYYLRMLKHGTPPHEAYTRALERGKGMNSN